MLTKLMACTLLAGFAAVHPASAAPADPVAGIPETRDEFHALFIEGRYAEALPVAERVVALTESGKVSGPEHVRALTDLALTQFRLGDMAGAEQTYLRALDWLEGTEGISSPQFVAPLTGLAQVYLAQKNPAIAVELLREALTTSRRSLGLFNQAQIPTLELLADCYMQVADYGAAEIERRYVVMIAEKNFGMRDPRMVPALDQLARWYESMDKFEAAREIYVRIYLVAGELGGVNNPTTIDALLGIGRTYRLQFVADPESLARRNQAVDQVSQMPTGAFNMLQTREFKVSKLDRTGLRAVEQALQILEKQTDPPAELMVRTLVELGDWYMTAQQWDTAMQQYQRALAFLASDAAAGVFNPLIQPRLVAHRPPEAAIRNRWLPANEMTPREVTFKLTVTGKGAVRDLVVADGSNASSMQAFQLSESVQRATYSPRFENGLPVESRGIEFKALWFEFIPPNAVETAKPPGTGG